MSTINFQIDGINYSITDLSNGTGLSNAQVRGIVERLHTTAPYQNRMNALKDAAALNNNDPSYTTIRFFIDGLGDDGPARTGIRPNNLDINLNSSEFVDGGVAIPDSNWHPMQNIPDMAIVHEVGHFFDAKVNGRTLGIDAAQDELNAIGFENQVRFEAGLPMRAADGHPSINYAGTLWFDIKNIVSNPEYIDPAQGGDYNILPEGYYTGAAPNPIPTTANLAPAPEIQSQGSADRPIFERIKQLVAAGDYSETARDEFIEDINEILENAGDAFASVPDWLDDLRERLHEFITSLFSPLVIDIDKSGTIDLISLSASKAHFDMDGDGLAEHTGWVAPTDGLLVYDRNQDGMINDISELFGSKQEEGFRSLAELDSNADGKIDINDEQWSSLQVWVDANGDGISQSGEVLSLGYYEIASISLTNIRVDNIINGNIITNEGLLTYDDNSTGKIVDAWFAYDNANSLNVDTYTLDMRTLALPSMRGYGDIKDLHIAMSMDNGADGLLEIVQNFVEQDSIEIFGASTLMNDMKEIMYKWAGVDNVSPTSRGSYVDAQKLTFLEKLTGADFLQGGSASNPRYNAGKEIHKTFNDALYNIFARIVMQTDAKALFEGDITYDIATDSFLGAGDLDATFLSNLTAEAISLPEALPLWESVLRVVIAVKGEANLTIDDIADLNAAIYASDAGLSYAIVRENFYIDATEGDDIDGTSSNDILTGSNFDDVIYGRNGADTLSGRDGGDILYGGSGNDTLIGGEGHDSLIGGLGNDTYIYNLGDGDDTILEQNYGELGDKIVFGAGITIGDLSFERISNTDLKIVINAVGGQGQIVIEKQFNGGSDNGSIETLEFSNATTFNLASLNLTLIGSNSNETLEGTRQSSGGNDTIYGMGGNDRINGLLGADILYGGDGDDTIYGGGITNNYYQETSTNYLYGEAGNDYLSGSYGVDHLYGGTGNDKLIGNRGDDHYYYNLGDGHDVIIETRPNDTDIIHFGAGITASNLSYIRTNNTDLKIMIDGGFDGSITIQNQFGLGSGDGGVEYIELSDTTLIDLSTLTFGLVGTGANESLIGTAGNDLIFGEGGNDTISGRLGNDTLYGGDGDDLIYGGGTTNNYYQETSTNYLYGDDGDDELRGSYGVDHLHGGRDNDYMVGSRGADHYYFSRGWGHDRILEVRTDIDYLHFDETIDLSDISYARSGARDLTILINNGYGGSVTIIDQFGTGSDDGAVERIILHDTTEIDLTTLVYTLYGTSGNDTLNGTTVNSGGDIIYGGDGNDTIQGLRGVDIIYGGNGNDILHGGGTNSDYYNETTSNTLYGEAGEDSLYGSSGTDYLYGGADNDTLNGRNGADFLYGGGGSDTLTGGSGADRFIFLSGETGIDTITDFSKGQNDKIDISDVLQGYDPLTHAITDWVEITTSGSNSILKVDTSGSGTNFVQIATISGVTSGMTDEAALVTSGYLIVA